ncbi:MAG: hypothetical protein JW940_11225 [Polyangiaceae bacterium]|nr:hypothetical protein [Polyangiaceae bacterium]
MIDICVREYLAHGGGQHLLTEGVMAKRRHRDAFVKAVAARCSLARALMLYVREDDLEFMTTRRRRSAEEYQALTDKIEVGSGKYDYVVYQSDAEERRDIDVRTSRVGFVLAKRLQSRGILEWLQTEHATHG